jgi:hypothetical protein
MTRIAAAIAAASLMATAAHAATVWQGEAIIDNASANCANIPSAALKADSVLKSVIKPKDIPGNTGGKHVVSFIGDGIAVFAIVFNNFPNGNGAAFGHTSSGVLKANVTTAYSSMQISPANPQIGTLDIVLRGTIRDFLFVPNCDVTFRVVYTKRTS